MNRFHSIFSSAAPGPGCKLRERGYSKADAGSFLRDIIALANAEADGPRYLICGLGVDAGGQRVNLGISEAECQDTGNCVSLLSEFVEPALSLRYETVPASGKRFGVFEIDGCYDQPYMMRSDHSEKFRRGDAWMQVQGAAVKVGREQLKRMFEENFHNSMPQAAVQIGFDGPVVNSDIRLPITEFEKLPSAMARTKIQQLIDMLSNAADTGASSRIGRLGQARLFGTDGAYDKKSIPELLVDLQHVDEAYHEHDLNYLFEKNGTRLQLVVLNQGDTALKSASLMLAMPRHDAFRVADKLPRVMQGEKFVDRGIFEEDSYPPVAIGKKAVRVAIPLGDVPVGSPIQVFESPLRVAAGPSLAGRRVGIRYDLTAANLSQPVSGKLRMLIAKT